MLEMLLRPNDAEERCGLVLEDGTAVEVKNIANDPVNSYEMDPKAVIPFLTDRKVVGTWHTHPRSSPDLSGEDYRGFLGWPEWKHYVIGVEDGKVVVKSYEIRKGAIFECD